MAVFYVDHTENLESRLEDHNRSDSFDGKFAWKDVLQRGQTAVLVCEWGSPAEFLLRPPGEHLLEPVPNNLPADTPEQK
jgi:hypothetical protein